MALTLTKKQQRAIDAFDSDPMFAAYIECMLWAENDESDERGGDPLDANYSPEDIAPESLVTLYSDILKFRREMGATIEACKGRTKEYRQGVYDIEEHAGHDLWLTMRGHGCGFWDGDWPEPEAGQLTTWCEKQGERYPYVGDDGKVWV